MAGSIDLELKQIYVYQVFKDLGKATYEKGNVTNLPSGYQKIQVHLAHDVNHTARCKARLVADGHLTREPLEAVTQEWFLSETSRSPYCWLNSTILSSGELTLLMHI